MSIKNRFAYIIYCFGFFFTVITVHLLNYTGNIDWNYVVFLKLFAVAVISSVIFGLIFFHFNTKIVKNYNCTNKKPSRFFFIISLFTLLLAWSVYFIAYYPGILAYDSPIQLGQIMDGTYNNHHPLFHTLFIKLCLSFSTLVYGEKNLGIAIYVVLQMVILALVISYALWYVAECFNHQLAIILLSIFAVFPVNGFMSVSVTKDVIFSSFMLLSFVATVEFLNNSDFSLRAMMFVIFSSLGIVLFRNNGKYALLFEIVFTALVILFHKKAKCKDRLKFLLASLVMSLGIGVFALNYADKKLNAVPGDSREMLSVPIQQLARVYVYHGGVGIIESDDNTLTIEEKILLDNFMLNESYLSYDSHISDPVKRNTNTYVPRYMTKDFITTYINLFKRYPEEYVNAFLMLNSGFLDPLDTSHAYINEQRPLKGLGYIQTRWSEDELSAWGFYKDSKWDSLHTRFETFADQNKYLDIPIIKYIFAPGIYFWITLAIVIVLFFRRDFNKLIACSLLVGYYITCFFGPTVQLRYIYPIMICVPFACVFLLVTESDYKENETFK